MPGYSYKFGAKTLFFPSLLYGLPELVSYIFARIYILLTYLYANNPPAIP